MTGHQVLSTLHTNSAIGAFPRLFDIGLVPDVLSSNISGIIGQRLMRKLCDHCKEPYHPDEVEATLLRCSVSEPPTIYREKGCKKCGQNGFKGRVPVLEVLRIGREIDDLIAKRASYHEIETAAIAGGYRTLADSAVSHVLNGVSTLDEAVRTVDMTSRLDS